MFNSYYAFTLSSLVHLIYLIKGHIISLLYLALSTSSFTVLILLNILYSYLLTGRGNKENKYK